MFMRSAIFRLCAAVLAVGSLTMAAAAHPPGDSVTAAAAKFVAQLPAEKRKIALRQFDDEDRFAVNWLPGRRAGLALDGLDATQTATLRALLHHVLSHAGQDRVDAVIATEAALGVLTNSPDFRNPKKYYTAVFGTPAPGKPWALRFEGHHLSVNLTFDGDKIVSASPLFVGANPETIPEGPDKGLRALGRQVDLARAAANALSPEQRKKAAGSEEWFSGFLSSPGGRRATLGKPAGIAAAEASPEAQKHLRALVADYVRTIAETYADRYLEWFEREEWPTVRFFWKGDTAPGATYYWRLQGRRFLMEHDGQEGGRHIHSIWRDVEADFGGLGGK